MAGQVKAKIVIAQAGNPPPGGYTSGGRDNLTLGNQITATNYDDANVTSWSWKLVVPVFQTATAYGQTGQNSSSTTFTPPATTGYGDCYLELTVTGAPIAGKPNVATDRVILGVRAPASAYAPGIPIVHPYESTIAGGKTVTLDAANGREGRIQEMAYALLKQALAGGGAVTPTGTGFVHVTSGVQDAAAKAVTSSDVDATVLVASGANPLTGDLSAGGHKISSLATPTATGDAATKGYVDGVASGLSIKASVRMATVSALPACTYANGSSGVGATLTANANGAAPAIDGVTPAVNDRILVKDEATGANRGIYVWTSVGGSTTPWVLTRATDSDTAAELAGAFVFVELGTTNAGSGWVLPLDATLVVGTTSQAWTQFSGAGEITAGTNLSKSGNTLSVVAAPTFSGTVTAGAFSTAGTLAAGASTLGATTATSFAGNGTPVTWSVLTHAVGGDTPGAVSLGTVTTREILFAGAMPGDLTYTLANLVEGAVYEITRDTTGASLLYVQAESGGVGTGNKLWIPEAWATGGSVTVKYVNGKLRYAGGNGVAFRLEYPLTLSASGTTNLFKMPKGTKVRMAGYRITTLESLTGTGGDGSTGSKLTLGESATPSANDLVADTTNINLAVNQDVENTGTSMTNGGSFDNYAADYTLTATAAVPSGGTVVYTTHAVVNIRFDVELCQ